MNDEHVPVLTDEVREVLEPRPGDVVLDATIGLAGHGGLFADLIGARGVLIGLDVDPQNLERSRQRLAGAPCRVELIHANFREASQVLNGLGIAAVDVLFADLGISSPQLDTPSRGFSFMEEGPLDMRLDPRLTVTAADLVNGLKERDLADLLYYNSQEMKARRIAQRICAERRDARITSTRRLAEVVASAQGVNPTSRKEKIHPATRTFMALRMAVNEEIPSLNALLEQAPGILAPGGRFGVIAFHSVEDKPVKLDFRRRKAEGLYDIITKKPLTASEEERRRNPRSRSAKLRAARRLQGE